MVRRLTARGAPMIAMAVPAGLLGVLCLVLLAGAAAGRGPFWRAQLPNVAEAAASRDRATMMRLIDEGRDPEATYVVATGALADGPLRLTPLEAAIAADRAEIVDLLLWRIDGGDSAALSRAWCLAQEVGDGSVARVIARYRSAAAEPECAAVERPW